MGAVGIIVVCLTYLFGAKDISLPLLLRLVTVVALSFGVVCGFGIPIAQVAEVFDYDVLRSLNNPVVIKKAQRHFGQQLLPHLHTLEWGFRVGQTVINMKVVMNIIIAIMLTSITATIQAAMKRI
eukprot:TRINITY_DN21281_c0_g1_i1.p1 TRINITY_DN21281_c0_g1~~TRINITY_DN21281_c0_g1_i1.p1  ORF type:complete len:132 (+),score=18.88 TRINITY_DN21281_c0_g1_i1:23-397(+)